MKLMINFSAVLFIVFLRVNSAEQNNSLGQLEAEQGYFETVMDGKASILNESEMEFHLVSAVSFEAKQRALDSIRGEIDDSTYARWIIKAAIHDRGIATLSGLFSFDDSEKMGPLLIEAFSPYLEVEKSALSQSIQRKIEILFLTANPHVNYLIAKGGGENGMHSSYLPSFVINVFENYTVQKGEVISFAKESLEDMRKSGRMGSRGWILVHDRFLGQTNKDALQEAATLAFSGEAPLRAILYETIDVMVEHLGQDVAQSLVSPHHDFAAYLDSRE